MNHAPEVPTIVVLHVAEERLEELIGGVDAGMEVREVDASGGEHNLRGVEVRVERRRAIPEADDGGSRFVVAAVAAEEGGPGAGADGRRRRRHW